MSEKIAKRNPDAAAPVYKPSNPFTARLVSNKILTEEGSSDDVRQLVLDLGDSGVCYSEGQSLGVIPPGTTGDGKKHKVRLYSIASCSLADEGKPGTVTLCVKRDMFTDPETGKTHYGICSNYLCDLEPGAELVCTGPVGKSFLLPKDDQIPLIFFAVGTGIAPYRGFFDFIRRERKDHTAPVYLFFGAKTPKECLYKNAQNNDLDQMMGPTAVAKFAFSRVEKNKNGGKMYIQNRLEEELDTIAPIIQSGNFSLYICGLKGMEAGINEVLSSVIDGEFKDFKKSMRQVGRWNVEVY